MHKHLLVISTALSLVHAGTALAVPAHAQSGKKKPVPVKKAAAAKPEKPAGAVVLGTTQLPGDFGKLGTTYTIGKYSPINFTLKSAEYSTNVVCIGVNTWVPKADEKVLLLHYTVHNPSPREQGYEWSGLRFTAVDAKDVNHAFIQSVAREGEQQPLSLNLKPAQKIDVCTAILVPAEGMVPKLIVERDQGAPVIRYDLRGKVKPLPEIFADPADTTGATARKEVAAQAGTFYATGVFDMRLDETAYVDGPLINREPGEGKRYMTATFTIRNRTSVNRTYSWSDFLPDLRDADGEKVAYTQALLKATRNETTSGEIAPGEEARVRFFFPLPTNVAGKKLRVAEGKQVSPSAARVFAFDLTAAGAQTAQK